MYMYMSDVRTQEVMHSISSYAVPDYLCNRYSHYNDLIDRLCNWILATVKFLMCIPNIA